RALLDQLVGRETHRLGHVAGDGEDFAAKLHREAGGDERSAVLGAFDDNDAERHAGHDAVPNWEILGSRMCAERELANDRAAVQSLIVEFFVFLGITHVDSRAENADRPTIDGHRALMRDRVHAASEAADDYQATAGDFPAKPFGHLRTV